MFGGTKICLFLEPQGLAGVAEGAVEGVVAVEITPISWILHWHFAGICWNRRHAARATC
jgi:hypothetical protein